MPTAAEHQRQVEHNLRFLESIDPDEFPDWMATVAFYVAVHLVEQLGAGVGHHSAHHADRLEFVRAQHPAIHLPFRSLFNISRRMRYEIGPHNWLDPDFVSGCLDEIQRYVREQLAPGAP